MSTFPSVPPGQHPPFATITDTDHRAWIIITTAIGISLTLVFGAMRVFIRFNISSSWGLDDATLGVSTILSIVQSSLILQACADGLGKSIKLLSLEEQGKIQQLYYGSNLLFILALSFSRVSVILFLRRLTPIPLQRRAITVLLSLIAAWTVTLFMASALQCNLSQPWTIVGQKCPGWFLRWEIMEVIGSLFEIAIFLIAVWLVWGLQTKFDNKAVVVIAFSFRLVMLIFTGLRLGSFHEAGFTVDPFLLETPYICWTQTELNYSIISATISVARQFVANLVTHYGGGHGMSNSGSGYGFNSANGYKLSNGNTQGASFQMSALKSNGRRKSGSANPKDQLPFLESRDDGVYSYGIEGPVQASSTSNAANNRTPGDTKVRGADAASVGSDDSQKMIIRKDITWQIQHDPTGS